MSNLNKLLRRWKEVLIITLVSRIVLFTYPLFFIPLNGDNFWNLWNRWDANHYLDIAKSGYQTNGTEALFIVFYPLYPLVVKIVSLIFNDFVLSGILVSLVFCFAAAILLYELTLLDFKRSVAVKAVWFLNIYPTTYFLNSPYTESLFLTVSLATLYFFRQEKFFKTGIFGALSTATRINGLLLLPILLMESLNLKNKLKSFITFLITPLGFIFYLGINWFYFSNPFHFLTPLQENWFKKSQWPWVSIGNTINLIPDISHPEFYIHFSEFIFIIFTLIIGIITFLFIRKSYGIYILINFLLITSTEFILSTPRYSLILFPIYITLATIRNKFLLLTVSVISLGSLFIFNHFYVTGKWAF